MSRGGLSLSAPSAWKPGFEILAIFRAACAKVYAVLRENAATIKELEQSADSV